MLVVKQAPERSPVEVLGTCITFQPPPRPGTMIQVEIDRPAPQVYLGEDHPDNPPLIIDRQYRSWYIGVIGHMIGGIARYEAVVEIRPGDPDPALLPEWEPAPTTSSSEVPPTVYGDATKEVDSSSDAALGAADKDPTT